MWACVCTSVCACAGVFARARAYTCMCIVRMHACMCLRAVRSAGACACMHVRMCLCVCVRMHACSGAGACVRTWLGSCVPGCMRVCARAPVCVVCMCMRVLARVRAHESVRALRRECACICVWAYADMCMYKMHKHIKQRVLSQRNNTQQTGGGHRRLYIYISLSFLSLPSPSFLPWYHHISV